MFICRGGVLCVCGVCMVCMSGMYVACVTCGIYGVCDHLVYVCSVSAWCMSLWCVCLMSVCRCGRLSFEGPRDVIRLSWSLFSPGRPVHLCHFIPKLSHHILGTVHLIRRRGLVQTPLHCEPAMVEAPGTTVHR